MEDDHTVTIGFDCPKGETTGLGGFQVDNVQLFCVNDETTEMKEVIAVPRLTPRYYSLTGVPVQDDAHNGIVIVKEGDTTRKVVRCGFTREE